MSVWAGGTKTDTQEEGQRAIGTLLLCQGKSKGAKALQKPSPAAKALQEPSPGLSRTCGSDCFSLTSAHEQTMGRRLFLFFSF